MEGNDSKGQTNPVIVVVDRRRQRDADLSPAEVMKIVRKRASLRKRSHGDADAEEIE